MIFRDSFDPADAATFSEQHAWMLSRMEAFRRAFGDRIKVLDLNATVDPEEQADEA